MGPTDSPETSVTIKKLKLRNIPVEPRPQTRRSESLECHRLQFPTSQHITSRPILILSFHPRLVFFSSSVRYSYQHYVHMPRVSLGVIIIIINSVDLLKCFKPQNIWISSLNRAFRKITSSINQQMHLYNFHLKHYKTLKPTPTCFDLFRSSSGSFVVPC